MLTKRWLETEESSHERILKDTRQTTIVVETETEYIDGGIFKEIILSGNGKGGEE